MYLIDSFINLRRGLQVSGRTCYENTSLCYKPQSLVMSSQKKKRKKNKEILRFNQQHSLPPQRYHRLQKEATHAAWLKANCFLLSLCSNNIPFRIKVINTLELQHRKNVYTTDLMFCKEFNNFQPQVLCVKGLLEDAALQATPFDPVLLGKARLSGVRAEKL